MLFLALCDKILLGEFETFLTYSKSEEKTKLKEKRMKKSNTLYLTRGAMVAALYVALTYLSHLFGLASGVIQFRLSEALCILPVFMPEATLGLFVGCLLSNLLTGCAVWDIIFGSLATLIGAVGAGLLRRLPHKLAFAATLPTLTSNAFIVPFVLIYTYGAEGTYLYFMITVGIGELVCACGGGTALYYLIKRYSKK